MGGLQVLEELYADEGFHVLGFYSNDFGKQGGTDEQIAEVTEKYHVTYPQFAIEPVSGDDLRPVFSWLLSHDNPGPKTGDVGPSWNFGKWLVSRKGDLVAAFDTRSYPGVDPNEQSFKESPIVQAIEAELAK